MSHPALGRDPVLMGRLDHVPATSVPTCDDAGDVEPPICIPHRHAHDTIDAR